MPLVDLLRDKWREMRIERLRGERSRQQVLDALNAQEKDHACRKIALWLKQADIKARNTIRSDDWYYSEAQNRIKGFRWRLHRLNSPFIWLEKKIIEPLDSWSDRANLFQFFSKASPLLEAIGVLAIPFVLFYYESQREERQIAFEKEREERQLEFQKNTIALQAEVRKQQAVRDYLSQITNIYLDVEDRDQIKQNEDLRKLLEANTLAIFDELSINETLQDESEDNNKLREIVLDTDRKGEVITFLLKLGWINGDEPLLSLSEANLSQIDLSIAKLNHANLSGANLSEADLSGADLNDANLTDADLRQARLKRTNLRYIDLSGADLSGADLSAANLRNAILSGAYLSNADLSRAYLIGADLRGTDLSGAILCRTTMPDRTTNNRDCE